MNGLSWIHSPHGEPSGPATPSKDFWMVAGQCCDGSGPPLPNTKLPQFCTLTATAARGPLGKKDSGLPKSRYHTCETWALSIAYLSTPPPRSCRTAHWTWSTHRLIWDNKRSFPEAAKLWGGALHNRQPNKASLCAGLLSLFSGNLPPVWAPSLGGLKSLLFLFSPVVRNTLVFKTRTTVTTSVSLLRHDEPRMTKLMARLSFCNGTAYWQNHAWEPTAARAVSGCFSSVTCQ